MSIYLDSLTAPTQACPNWSSLEDLQDWSQMRFFFSHTKSDQIQCPSGQQRYAIVNGMNGNELNFCSRGPEYSQLFWHDGWWAWNAIGGLYTVPTLGKTPLGDSICNYQLPGPSPTIGTAYAMPISSIAK